MSKFKVGDRVLVIKERANKYLGKIDIIESIRSSGWDGAPNGYYLKNCHLKLDTGHRLWFYESELELVKDFYWLKKSIDV